MNEKTLLAALVVGAGLLAGAVPAQDSQERAETTETERAQQEDAAEQHAQIQEWVSHLGHERFRIREAAFQKLAAAGDAAREALDAAVNSDDPEVRDRVRQLLAELGDSGDGLRELPNRRSDGGPTERPRHRPQGPDSIERLFPELEQWMQRMGGGAIRGLGRPPFHRFDARFGDLDDLFEMPGRTLDLTPGSSWSSTQFVDGERRGISVRVDADGSIEVVETVGDETQTTTAAGREELERAHPELYQRLKESADPFAGMDPDGFPAPLRDPPNFRWPVPDNPAQPRQQRPAPTPQGPTLGVQVEPVHPAVSDYLGLDPALGLMVIEVVPGSIAEQVGLKPKDLLLEVSGRPVRGVEDVRRGLEAAAGGPSEVTVLRKGQRRELRSL